MISLLILLAGCMGNVNDLASAEDTADMVPGTLTTHVYPGSESGLLPQTFAIVPVDREYGDVSLPLAETVDVSGLLTSLVAHPWSAVGAPTAPEPFAGLVEVSLANSVQSAAVRADETGLFTFQIPADAGYDLYFRPDDATGAPATGLGHQSFFQDTDLTQELSEGVPIFGRVTALGVGVAKAPLVLTRLQPVPVTSSQVFYTDSEGWYTARAPDAGTYRIEVQEGLSGAGVVLPAVERRLTINDQGGSLDIDLGALAAAVVTGTVNDMNGNAVADAQIRLSSSALESVDGTLEVLTTTDVTGSFVARLIPGQFTAEILPAYQAKPELSPTAVPITVEIGSTDVGIITLGGVASISGVVNLPGERGPAAGVSVTATQVGWSQYAWSTTTDESGNYTLSDLPLTDFVVLCTPPTTSGAAATRVDLPIGGDPSIMLVEGTPLSGIVTSPDGVAAYALVEVHDAATDLVLGTALTNSEGAFEMVIDMPEVDPADTDETGDTGGRDTSDTGGTDTGGTDTSDTGGTDTGADTGGTDTSGADTSGV